MLSLPDGTLVLAATDLTNHLACAHLTQQRLAVARGERSKPRPADDPHSDLIRRRGEEHRAAGGPSITSRRVRGLSRRSSLPILTRPLIERPPACHAGKLGWRRPLQGRDSRHDRRFQFESRGAPLDPAKAHEEGTSAGSASAGNFWHNRPCSRGRTPLIGPPPMRVV